MYHHSPNISKVIEQFVFFHKGSVLGTLFSRRQPLVHKTDPPIFPLDSMKNNGPKTDTHGQQLFSYLAYIGSLAIIYQHVEVYTLVHTFLKLTIIWCSYFFPFYWAIFENWLKHAGPVAYGLCVTHSVILAHDLLSWIPKYIENVTVGAYFEWAPVLSYA